MVVVILKQYRELSTACRLQLTKQEQYLLRKEFTTKNFFIEKSNIVLEGEEKEKTIITAAIARR
jgi:hypothetical protein